MAIDARLSRRSFCLLAAGSAAGALAGCSSRGEGDQGADSQGAVTQDSSEESAVPREDIFVTTKLYPTQFGEAGAAIDAELEKMGLDYIDMMLLRHPGTGDVNACLAMGRALDVGKIRCLGLSNWYVEELEDFLPKVNATPALVQNEIHPYYQESEVVDFIQGKGIAVQAWYPLGGRGQWEIHTG